MQTPWSKNPVVLTTYLGQLASVFFAVSPAIVSYPGAPGWLVSAIGVIGVVLLQLGYQAHSATVRAAELAAAPPAPAPTPRGI